MYGYRGRDGDPMKKALAGFLAFGMVASVVFTNSILAGNTLVRDAITSENYVADVSGWSIQRNGDAEFNNLFARGVIRGSVVTDIPPEPRIEIDSYRSEGITSGGQIRFYGPGWTSSQAVQQELTTEALDPSIAAVYQTHGPNPFGGIASLIVQTQYTDGTNEISLHADDIIIQDGEIWHNFPLVNSWATLSGIVPRYSKTAENLVSVTGRISGGTTGTVGTLPLGYRPATLVDMALKSNGDAASVSWVQITSGGVINVVGNVAAAQTWLSFNFNFSARL